MRVDKALSELWDLRQSDDEGLVETSLIAINTIKRLQKECEDKRYLSEENAKLHGRIAILENTIAAIAKLQGMDEVVHPIWSEISKALNKK